VSYAAKKPQSADQGLQIYDVVETHHWLNLNKPKLIILQGQQHIPVLVGLEQLN